MLTTILLLVAQRPDDEVKQFPGFSGKMPSKVFSGYLKASAEGQTFYSHYVLTESQRSPASDPLVLWQQGGPGSSGFGFGYLAELGPYVLDADSLGTHNATPKPQRNTRSWDGLANLLLFEHPPGTGFSYCVDASDKPTACEWNDQTQAVAFYNTLTAFYAAWPTYSQHELKIIGESYAGLLIPFLTHEIYKRPKEIPARQLRGIAMGNGCPGTSGATPTNRGTCNGPYGSYDTQHIMELAYGHSALPRDLYSRLSKACGFPCAAPTWSEDCHTFSDACQKLLDQASTAIGSFNIYNFYDNCGNNNQASPKNPQMGTFSHHHARFDDQRSASSRSSSSAGSSLPHEGGQEYPCGTGHAAVAWCNTPSVRAALHMHPEAFYGRPWALQAGPGMRYTTYTGASYDLYPSLLQHVPVLIYNGDVDACVPYNSNADWIAALAAQEGYDNEADPWRPWLLDRGGGAKTVAGYVTRYATGIAHNLTFLTIKESGHMVPQYQPDRALAFFPRWLKDQPY